MTYHDVLDILVGVRGSAAVVAGPGLLSRLLWAARHETATIYQMELGYPTAVAMGMALARPEERVVALEGDGSMLAGIGVLTTVARYRPPHLVVIVCDNGVYGTVGGGTVETATRHGTDLAAIGRACGWDHEKVITVETRQQTTAALSRAWKHSGPWLIVARVGHTRTDAVGGVGQIPFDIVEGAIAFRREMIIRGHGIHPLSRRQGTKGPQ